jgi:hypothetical protein
VSHIPETFGRVPQEDQEMSQEQDQEMIQDDQVDLAEEPLNPSKQKISKYLEDQRHISGTFGEGTNQF